MPLSVSQLIESAETGGEALRLIRAARDCTQAEIVELSEGTIGVDQISLIERGKRSMTSKQCTAIAKALNLTNEEEAQIMLLALIDRAPERLKPVLRRARLGIKLLTFEAFLKDYPQAKITECIATLDAVAEVWPKVKARWEHS
ncbi:MAG TPA: helix-turn-helix transcriptional regulator [Candidatus Saccharimonadia bacterium]|nr:helix-turn-helix transcriptional regulator [Candidatus Saccharimonadia bacterium]